MIIHENGNRKEITKLEAAMKQLTNKAASGDVRAISLLLAIMRGAEQDVAGESFQKEFLTEDDQKVMQTVLKRMRTEKEGE